MARPKREGFYPIQIRLPKELHEYIKEEAVRTEVPQNSVMITLLDYGVRSHKLIQEHPEEILKILP